MKSFISKKILIPIACLAVLAIVIGSLHTPPEPPNFSDYLAGPERKQVFFNYFLPLIEEKNQAILETRRQLKEWRQNREDIGWWDASKIQNLAEDYGMKEFEIESDPDWTILLRRVDAVPPSLALAQAAAESNWGASRFARLGNNFFGQWCFEDGCGIVPDQRDEGKKHEIAIFDSPADAVASYLHNLNSHVAYTSFRILRAKLRAAGIPVTGSALVPGLDHYSERGAAYLDDLRALIDYNHLSQYDLP